MRRFLPLTFVLLLDIAFVTRSQQSQANQAAFSRVTKSFIAIDSPVIALQHVRVIDGTGAAPSDDQTLLIENGNIREIGPAATVNIPQGAHTLDLSGHSVIPGLVGMHEHMYYPAPSGAGPTPGAPLILG